MIDKKSDITVWILRHGARIDLIDQDWRITAENPYNPPLAPVGFEQAAETGERLKSEGIDHIIASPFLRTVQTANVIGEKIGKKINLETGLSEWMSSDEFDYKPEIGDQESLSIEFPRINPGYQSLVGCEYPEDPDHLERRVEQTISELIKKYGSTLLLVSHGSPLRSIFKVLINYTKDEYPPMCSLSRFHYHSGKWELEIDYDSTHLTNPDNTESVFYKERWK